jgi:hypothetical protein
MSLISSNHSLKEVIFLLMLLAVRYLDIAIGSRKVWRVEVKEHITGVRLEVQSIGRVEVTYKGFAPLS